MVINSISVDSFCACLKKKTQKTVSLFIWRLYNPLQRQGGHIVVRRFLGLLQ